MMGWYAASIIMYTEFKDGVQDKYPVWENIILIEGQSETEAKEKAEKRGREDEGDCCAGALRFSEDDFRGDPKRNRSKADGDGYGPHRQGMLFGGGRGDRVGGISR